MRTIFLINGFLGLLIALLYASNRPMDLFARYPIQGSKDAILPNPIHVYSADVASILGRCSYSAARELMKGQNYYPIKGNDNGQAFASINIITYNSTSLGPYKEVIVSFLASQHQDQKVDIVNDFTPNVLLGTNPEIVMYSWKLWLNEEAQKPITIGREIFGLDKRKMHVEKWFDYSRIKNANWTYREYQASFVEDGKSLDLIDFRFEKEASPFRQVAYLPIIMKAWGYSNLIGNVNKLFSTEVSYSIVGPKGNNVMNPVSQLISNPSVDIGVTFWNNRFTLALGGDLKSLQFTPNIILHDPWMQFVLVPPYNLKAQSQSQSNQDQNQNQNQKQSQTKK